jgi:RHS repeat-associated protein
MNNLSSFILKSKKVFILFIFSFLLITISVPKTTFAAGNPFVPTTDTLGTGLTPQIGGQDLDVAAQSLANMTDITGAYYDSATNRIVFVGKTGGTSPQFNKDDMAVAIKAIFFSNTMPNLNIGDDPSNPSGPNALVTYTGGIQNTSLGNVLFNADYKLKQYVIGYTPTSTQITSTVPSYKSVVDRYKLLNPNPVNGNQTKFILTPQTISMKTSTTANAFVFNNVTMQATTQVVNANNDPLWNQAAANFATDVTTNYDAYAQETPSFVQAKQLGKIISILKWISDKNVPTDFQWARDYIPQTVSTPTSVQKITSPVLPNGYTAQGEINYNTPNNYLADDGTAAGLKTSSQSVSSSPEDVTWTFTNGGQQYQAVAVASTAFKSLGSFNTSATDFSTPIAGDMSLSFSRTYSSFAKGQFGIGIGWDFLPASLYPNSEPDSLNLVICNSTIFYSKVAIDSASGHETFTYNCSSGYGADQPSYHSKLVQNSDGSYIVTAPNLIKYKFNTDFQLLSLTDTNNNAINYSYDTNGKLTGIADTKSHNFIISYNAQNLISKVQDWSGRFVQYFYDTKGNLTSVIDPRGNTATYGYDANSKLITITDRNSQLVLTNTYGSDAKINSQKDASNVTRTNTYDNVNKLITQTDSLGRVVKTFYDTNARILQQIDPNSKTTTYTYGNEAVPLTETDKNGNKTTYVYDSNGNVTSVTTADNSTISYTYDTNNRLTKVTDTRYGTPARETTLTYDANGNITKKTEAGIVTSYTYDTTGERLSLTDPLLNMTIWTRDSLGNNLTKKDPYNKVTTYEYDTVGRQIKQTDPDNKILTSTYDANGNLLTKTDAAGTVTNTYDKENRLTKITLPNNTVTQYTYNASSSLTAVIDALNNTTNYGYDSYQNLISQQDALNHTTLNAYDSLNQQISSTTPLGKATSWQYDANGNITQRKDANNQITTYQYDNLNRLTKITYPDTKTVTYQYDKRGNLTSMIDPNGTFTYVFDNFDRMSNATNPFGQSIQYTYDNANNLTKLTYPDGKNVNYTYDKNNRMLTVTDWNNKVITYAYNNNGSVATRAYPNGITTYYTYDNANRVTTLEHKSGATSKAKFALTKNSVGNITLATQSGSLVQAQTNPYSYDNLGRLTSATLFDPNNNTYNYTYDSVGNVTQFTNQFLIQVSNTYDADNKVINSDGHTQLYDNNGNLTQRVTNQTHGMQYDFENRVKQYDSYTYTYDGLGNRLSSNGFDNFRYITDTNSSLSKNLADYDLLFNKYKYYYIYGIGQTPIAQYVNTGGSSYSAQYYVEDAVGNTRWMTDSSGNTAATLRYDPYGNFTFTQYLPPTFLFSGQKYDFESGLTYMRARYYDPSLMRFTSRDPNPGGLQTPLSQNAYQYAYDNPINMSDPSGRCLEDLCIGETIIIGSVLSAAAPVLIAAGDSVAKDIQSGNYANAVSTASMFVPVMGVESTAANIAKSFVTKGATKDFILSLKLPKAQVNSVIKAIQKLTTSTFTSVIRQKNGNIVIQNYREGRDGFQVLEYTITPSGEKHLIQKAYNSKGELVHYDPKF